MNFRDIDIHELIPQREPFMMIDRLVHYEEKAARSEFTVREDNPLLGDEVLSGAGIMENVAQTCAAWMGYYQKYILKVDVSIGYIGAIRNFSIYSLPLPGEKLTTEIELLEEIFNITMMNAKVYSGDRLIAEGIMKIALASD